MTTPIPDPAIWLNAQLRIQLKADREVLAALKVAQRDINRQLRAIASRGGVGATVRREQLLFAKRAILREQAMLWRSLGQIVDARRAEAAAAIIRVGRDLDSVLLRAIPRGASLARAIADSEEDRVRRNLDQMIARVNGDSYVPLSQKVYRSELGITTRVNRLVNSALARGLSALEFAREARDFVNPFTPGGLRYAAMRLARTEINNAAHAVAIDAQRDKPWVQAMEWHLSRSHPKPDACDSLAHGGERGDGKYPVEQTPAKPHPQCFCYITPATVSPEEFLGNLVAGRYADYLSQYRNLAPGQVVRTTLG
jgi:hypothetical protein